MSSQKILIASILKPVDDTRMFEKIGISLSKVKGFSVNIAGHVGKIQTFHPINTHIINDSSRLSLLSRLMAGFKVLWLMIRLKPKILIIETHELLWLSWFSWIFNTRFIYDVRENYRLTIKHSAVYGSLVALVFKTWVIFWEWASRPFIHTYFVAENVYFEQLQFLRHKGILLENKAAFSEIPKPMKRDPNLWLFTGTIASQCGIWECLDLFEKHCSIFPDTKLIIAGKCHLSSELSKLKDRIKDISNIQLIGGSEHVPHNRILQLQRQAGIGFIYYRDIPHIQRKNPTKLFEYLASGLLILFFKSNNWLEITNPHQESIVVETREYTPKDLQSEIEKKINNCKELGNGLDFRLDPEFISIV